ncbi:MAG: hypothetical protein JWN84_346 [Nocardioides sp.]|nr:hypothetical protein [Nocardioides sp.]
MSRARGRARGVGAVALGLVAVAALGSMGAGFQGPRLVDVPSSRPEVAAPSGVAPAPGAPADRTTPHRPVTLAFAGDVHFEGAAGAVLDRPGSTLGPMSARLRAADVAVVNLESALTSTVAPARKELEDPGLRYWFRSPPSALGVLARSGVDAVSVANNHGADHGVAGLRDTLRIASRSRVAVVGAGVDERAAFRPYRTTVRGTDVAVLAADASPRESADPVWAVGPGSGPGLATARLPHVRPLLAAVRAAAVTDDVVAVYLHWGIEGESCPSARQQRLAQALSEAGADVVVGSHTHLAVGAGTLGRTYVSYGLGNFHWYHGIQSETGVLTVTVADGGVTRETWDPARIPPQGGVPLPLTGPERVAAIEEWRRLRSCTDLRAVPDPAPERRDGPARPEAPDAERPPPFSASIRRIGPALRARMTSSHDPRRCPVPLADLRHVVVPHFDYDGRVRRGEIVLHADVARDVAGVFAALYRARFPVARMRLVDAYGGDDNRSMAANNTSGYNCRTVAGTSTFSDHAYGRAVDINPVQNPYVLGDRVLPGAGRPFVAVPRGTAARTAPGVIRDPGVVTRAFARIGWRWGGTYSDPDYQHFSAP